MEDAMRNALLTALEIKQFLDEDSSLEDMDEDDIFLLDFFDLI